MTPSGPVAVYRDRSVDEIRDIYLTRHIDGEWQAGQAVGDDGWEIPGCPVNGPVIQANGSQLAVAWFSGSDGLPRVQVAWSDDAGESISAPVDVATGGLLGHVGGALLPSGDMAVSWLSSAEDGTTELIAEATGVAAFSVPQVALLGEDLLLAWTDASGEHSLVRTALVPLQFLD
jgi:hypothetical protein